MIPCKRALPDFIDMLEQSWKFEESTKQSGKLTKEQKERFKTDVIFHTRSRLFGTYPQRFKILNAVYDAYLIGLGYDPMGWRNE